MKKVYLDFEKPIAELEKKIEDLQKKQASKEVPERAEEIERLTAELKKTEQKIYTKLDTWQRVQLSRHGNRPFMLDYVEEISSEFTELHGDRHYGDDQAMPGGFATIEGRKVMILGQQKGRDTKENLRRNFGMAQPEGYRKAMRLMKLAEKFGLPVVTLIDTPGAYPGVGAEERNIAEAIAYNLREMAVLRTPIVSVVIGEGGSGGALGIGVSDRVLMMENAYYSVISPEGCAAILWKDRKHAPDAAEALRLSSRDLKALKIVDEVIPEPLGGAHRNAAAAARALRKGVVKHLDEICETPLDDLLDERYERFRNFGEYTELAATG